MEARYSPEGKHYYRYVMLTYVICIGTIILVSNAIEGNPIGIWTHTSANRPLVGEEFATFVVFSGGWVYPLAAQCAYEFLWQISEEKRASAKIACAARAVVAIFFLVCFMILNVARFIYLFNRLRD